MREFHQRNDGDYAQPGCAACGVRATARDAPDYQRRGLELLDCLRFTREQEVQLLAVPEQYRATAHISLLVASMVAAAVTLQPLYPTPVTPRLRPLCTFTCTRSSWTLRATAASAPSCVAAVWNAWTLGTSPPMSLAAGWDYGVLGRVLPGDPADYSALVLRIAVAKNRLYLQFIKMKAIGTGSGRVAASGVTGHAVVFAHTAPEAVAEARPQLSRGVRDMLHVVLLAPPALHPLLRRCGLALPDLRAPPARVFAVLGALKAVHPGYAQLQLGEVDTPQERMSLERLHADLIAVAVPITDEEGLAMEAIATSDVAAIRAPTVAGSAGAAGATKAAAAGAMHVEEAGEGGGVAVDRNDDSSADLLLISHLAHIMVMPATPWEEMSLALSWQPYEP